MAVLVEPGDRREKMTACTCAGGHFFLVQPPIQAEPIPAAHLRENHAPSKRRRSYSAGWAMTKSMSLPPSSSVNWLYMVKL